MSKENKKKQKHRWTIKEDKDGVEWWMIRGGAFSNKINKRYPHRLFESRMDAEVYSNSINRSYDRKSKIVQVECKNGKSY